MAQHIKADGTCTEVKPALGRAFTYEELVNFIGSKPIDILRLPSGNFIVIDDEGKLKGLPVNPQASAIWKKEYPLDKYPFNNDGFIVGDVLFASGKEIN